MTVIKSANISALPRVFPLISPTNYSFFSQVTEKTHEFISNLSHILCDLNPFPTFTYLLRITGTSDHQYPQSSIINIAFGTDVFPVVFESPSIKISLLKKYIYLMCHCQSYEQIIGELSQLKTLELQSLKLFLNCLFSNWLLDLSFSQFIIVILLTINSSFPSLLLNFCQRLLFQPNIINIAAGCLPISFH